MAQLVDALVIFFFFPIWFLWARLLMRIYKSYAWGLRRSSEAQRRCINGGGGRTMNW
jgi:hypothetical protein